MFYKTAEIDSYETDPKLLILGQLETFLFSVSDFFQVIFYTLLSRDYRFGFCFLFDLEERRGNKDISMWTVLLVEKFLLR